jgi:ferric-dicitrate binding protein FerR (iron transport regulator)
MGPVKHLWAFIFLFVAVVPPAILWADDAGQNQQVQLFVAQVQGKLFVVHNGTQHQANPPEPLAESDEIKTDANSKGYLEFQNGSVVEVGPNSDTTVSQLDTSGDDFKARFLLAWGKLKAQVKKLTTSNSSFEVEAGGVVAGVRGTVFGVDYDKTQKKVDAQTFEGSIFTRAGGKEQVVEKGYGLAVQKTGFSPKSPLTGQQMNSFRDFVDVSGQLEQKKQEMLQDMHNKIMEKLPVPESLKNTIGQHLPF